MKYYRAFLLLCIVAIVSSGCSNGLWGEYATPTLDFSLYFTATPFEAATLIPTPAPATVTPTIDLPTPTQEPSPFSSADIIRRSQTSGDLLLPKREIPCPPSPPDSGSIRRKSRPPIHFQPPDLLNPGTLMLIPDRMTETSPSTLTLPDSEFVYSASALEFDIRSIHIADANGHLNEYYGISYEPPVTHQARTLSKDLRMKIRSIHDCCWPSSNTRADGCMENRKISP